MNLVDSYERVEVPAIATQLAVLEIVTYGNAIGTGLKQTRDQAAKLVNWISRKFSNSNLVEVMPAVALTDQVIRRSESYANIPKSELISRVIQQLATRLECSNSNREELSAKLVSEAAAGLDIDEDLLVGQKAEQVALKYWESVLEQIREKLAKQSPAEAKATEDAISQQLREMKLAERLELQKTLNMGSLSGEAVRRAFLQAGGPLAAIGVVNMMGFGAFIALSTIIHAIFTTVLGITLPFVFYTGASGLLSILTGPVGIGIAIAAGMIGYALGHKKLNRAQYAMIVWTCVTHFNAPLYADTALLPSMKTLLLLPADDEAATQASAASIAEASDQELSRRSAEKEAARTAHATAATTLASVRKELERTQARVGAAEAQLAVEKLRTTETAAALEKKTQALSQLQSEISRFITDVGSLTEKMRAAEARAQELEKDLQSAESRFEAQVLNRRQEIEKLWAVHFPTLKFSPRALRWVAEKTFAERLEVERALIELREVDDPVSLSRGKMSGTDLHHSAFKLSPKVPARIYFRVKGSEVEITQILKKNESNRFSATA